MQKNKTIITIPIYKTELSHWEEISLQQGLSILQEHPIVLISPKSLDVEEFQYKYGIKDIIRFDDIFFKNIDGYNRLMLSPLFYEQFLDYEYILVYQLDAYVFSDKLQEWCAKGYDYIGAPWIPSAKYNKNWNKAELIISQFFARMFLIYNSRSNYFKTGNGGFSLRNTDTCFKITKSDRKEINKFLSRQSYHYAEDIYWGIHANRVKQRLSIPHYTEAISFAFENNPDLLYKYNNEQLPFGAHAWYKESRLNFWKPFIPQLNTVE